MRRKPDLLGEQEDHALRFAWGIAFIATLALVAVLGLARSAQALTLPVGPAQALIGAPAPPPAAAASPSPATFDEEKEAEASEDEESEFVECEDFEECEEDGDNPEAPPECLLDSAEATVFAASNHDRVRLQVRYTATSPTPVAFDYGLHGSKGSLYLGGEKKRLSRHGIIRLDTDLTETQMAKVLAAKNFTVRLRVPAAPRYCQPLFERQLDVRRALPSGLAWEQAG
jgi:hypothetical protein